MPHQPGMKTIGSKWVFKVIPDGEGDEPRLKARLCALGYMQEAGIDYTETFVPVVRYDSLRILRSLIAYEDLEMLSFDVRSTFLHGELKEVLYMKVPEGVNVTKNSSETAVRLQ